METSDDLEQMPNTEQVEPDGIPAVDPVSERAPVVPDVAPPRTVLPSAPGAPRRPLSAGAVVAIALVVALLFGTAAGLGGAWAGLRLFGQKQSTVTVVQGSTEEGVAAAAAAALPSVVNVDVTGEATSEDESLLPTAHPSVPVVGNGSGVAFRAVEGGGTYILTNDHVVADSKTIVVTGQDGERHDATLIGTDPETDIAVLKIAATMPVIKTGDSEKLVVGQLVVVIGSPFGLQHSVTSGVVSAMHRSLPDSTGSDSVYPLVDVIQTDAAINPGNSGGALVDRFGSLVGIPSAIYSESGANDGVGFAIPVNAALRVADALIKTGTVEHPFLGISGQTVTADFAATEKLPAEEGAYVVEITKGTEAEKAGLRKGDLIVKLDTTPIRSMDDLILAVRRKAIGDTVTLSLYRDDALINVEMKVGVKPANL
jgi:putative serine protease PepD